MTRDLPKTINLLAYPWMRSQVMQYVLNPNAREGLLRLAKRYSPVASVPVTGCPATFQHVEDAQFQTMRRILTLGYQREEIEFESYHSDMTTGGTDITVDIGPDGDLVLVDGAHRIFFLLISGAATIDAVVRHRHTDWTDFVSRVERVADGYIYAEIPHPDFCGYQVGRTECRVQTLYTVIKGLGIKSAVDLGCCSGAFACDLSSVVPQVHGIDKSADFLAVAEWRARHSGSAATFSQGDLLDYNGDADLVSALSVLHHVITEHGLPRIEAWLAQLSCRYLLLEYPAPGEILLKRDEASAEFGRSAACTLTRLGYSLKDDLGLDLGFPGIARSIHLWGR